MKQVKQLLRYPVVLVFFLFLFGYTLFDLTQTDREYSEFENKYLAQKPPFTMKAFLNNEWTQDYEEYINDQFILRDDWITLKSICESMLLKIENNGIAYGEDGYMFEKFTTLSGNQRTQYDRNLGYAMAFLNNHQNDMAWVEKHCKTHEGEDLNPEHLRYSREKKDEVWEYVVKMTMIFRDLMVGNPKLAEMGFEEEAAGHNAIAGGFQGQRQWTDFRPDGDFSEAILNTSFDWNGIREAYTFATENDTLNGVSMLFMHLLTNQAQLFSDVRTYWSPEAVERATGRKLTGKAANGIIHLINSGSSTLDASGAMSDAEGNPVMKPFWEITEQEAERCLEATTWHPAGREYMRGGGFSSKFFTRGDMPVTMCRLNLIKGQGPVLQIAEGWAVNVDRAIFEHIDKRTDPSWPTTYFAPRLTDKGAFKSVYNVMNNWGANHGAITYGHVGADLITLASMLRIPVCMHNIDEEKIFRPSAWAAFGSDPEGSDYRACNNYGPVYK